MSSGWKPDTLVWARLEGYPDWPSLIVDPLEAPRSVIDEGRKGDILVLFFGSNDFGWVSPENISAFRPNYEKNRRKGTDDDFLLAVQEADKWNPESKKPLRALFKDDAETPESQRYKKKNMDTDNSADEESSDDDGASSKASSSQKSKSKHSSKSGSGSKHLGTTKTIIINSGEDDIENSDISEPKSSKSAASKKRKAAVPHDEVDLFGSHDISDDEISSTRSKKPKTNATAAAATEKLAATQKIPAPSAKASKNAKNKKSTIRNSGDPSAEPLSSGAAASGAASNSGQQQRGSTQSKLEFRAMTGGSGSGGSDNMKIGLSSSSSGIPKISGKNGSAPPAIHVLPSPHLPPPAPVDSLLPPPSSTGADDLLLMPTQPWVEPADGEVPAVSPASQSILELTPARSTRSAKGVSAAGLAPSTAPPAATTSGATKAAPSAPSSLNMSNIFAESPQKRPLRSTTAKRGGSGAASSESQEQHRDLGSLDIMPTQPFVEDDNDGTRRGKAASSSDEPYVPPSQLLGPAEPAPTFGGRRGGALAAGKRTAAQSHQQVPPSPILASETPGGGMGRRRSSRLSQQDMDATIQDPSKMMHLGAQKGAGGALLIDFNESQAPTAPIIPTAANNLAAPFIGFTMGKGAPSSPSTKKLTGASSAAGTDRKLRSRANNQLQQPNRDDDFGLQQQNPAAASSSAFVSGPGLTKEDVISLLKEERERTISAVQDALDQTSARLEASLLSKLDQSFKKYEAASTKSFDELKRHLTDVVRIEVRTAIADSVTAQDVGVAQQPKPQHVQAIVQSLDGVEKMIAAWRASLQPSSSKK